MKYLLLLLLIAGCSTQVTQDPYEIYRYEGLTAFSANSVAAADVTPIPKPDVGSQVSPDSIRRVYFITAPGWCAPCIKFYSEVLPKTGLTYGPKNPKDTAWDKDVMIIDYDKNQDWIRNVLGFEPNGITLPYYILEIDGLSNNRKRGAKTFIHTGFMSKEEFMKFYEQE